MLAALLFWVTIVILKKIDFQNEKIIKFALIEILLSPNLQATLEPNSGIRTWTSRYRLSAAFWRFFPSPPPPPFECMCDCCSNVYPRFWRLKSILLKVSRDCSQQLGGLFFEKEEGCFYSFWSFGRCQLISVLWMEWKKSKTYQ